MKETPAQYKARQRKERREHEQRERVEARREARDREAFAARYPDCPQLFPHEVLAEVIEWLEGFGGAIRTGTGIGSIYLTLDDGTKVRVANHPPVHVRSCLESTIRIHVS